ncbi:MAG: hypothetical protein KBT00_00850 [Bacteroidales bacterium]|nr:hypothetical protein [Candidatus Cacconaster merdequi]
MSDTDAATMEQKLRTLYQIQQADTKIDKIYLLRGELPLEVQDLEDEIEGLRTRIANAKGEISSFEQSISDYRNKLEESKMEIAKYEEQRNNGKNNREYVSLSKEIEYQELEQKIAEKRIKEFTSDIEEKNELVAETAKTLELREADLVEKKKELETIVEETSKEEAALKAEKDELVSKIDERMVVAYNKVRANAHNHLAVVTVKRDACGGCFNKIPPQKRLDIIESKKIIVCEYCGRILVNPDFDRTPDQKQE